MLLSNFSAMQTDVSIHYDGVNEQTEVAYDAIMEEADFSIAFWMKLNSSATGSQYIATRDDGGGRYFLVLHENGKIRFLAGTSVGTPSVVTSAGLLYDSWHHVVCTFESNTAMRVYVDGELKNSRTSSVGTVNSTTAKLYIGSTSASLYRDCNLQQFTFFDNHLDATECAALFNRGKPIDPRILDYSTSGANIVYLFPLGWGDTEDAQYDIVGGLTGTGENMEAADLENESPDDFDAGASLLMDGVSEYITISDDASFDVSDFSLSFWIKPTGSLALSDVLSRYTSGQETFRIRMLATGAIYCYLHTGSTTEFWYGDTTNLALNTWYHVCMVFGDSGTTELYINGSEESNNPTQSFSVRSTSTSDIQIGRSPLGNFFEGNMSNVIYYDKALSSGEVSDLYNSGTIPDPMLLSTQTNMIGYWKLGNGGDSEDTFYDSSGNELDGTGTLLEWTDIEVDAP